MFALETVLLLMIRRAWLASLPGLDQKALVELYASVAASWRSAGEGSVAVTVKKEWCVLVTWRLAGKGVVD